MNLSRPFRVSLGRIISIYLPVLFFLVFTLFPIYWLLNSSLKLNSELFAFPPHYLPETPTLQNFIDAMLQTRLGKLYINSLLISGGTCLALMVPIIFSGYALARFNFTGKSFVLVLFLLTQMLPHVVLLVPLFTIFRSVGLINNALSLIITYTGIWLPFSVMMMHNFYAAIPVELEEAAMVDGCSRTSALFRVVLPIALPGLVATAIFGFINAWNELIFATVFINSPGLQTLPVGLASLRDENRTEYGMIMAVSVLALIPSMLFFGYIQRYLTTGLAAGAVKG